MPQDQEKFRGSTKRSKPDAGGANIRSVPVFGIVKDNIDPIRSGRLKVYISDFGGIDPDDSSNWVSVNYMSNFFGRVNGDGGSNPENFGTYVQNPSSYGEWHAPPDIGTTVICIFVNGDMNYGYYIGAVPEPQALQMIPAIGAEETIIPNEEEARAYSGATVLPVTNMNINNFAEAYESDFIKTPKPIHSYAAAIMAQQGIIRDPIRGPITSSALREPVSRVGWGVSTPGRPIYEGGYTDQTIDQSLLDDPKNLRVIARRGGHSIVMDDGDVLGNDDLIRIRTARGHQIMMSDNGQTLMILHSNGQSYIELGKEGTVDIYSTNSINLRTQGDLNLHADNNVNIHAKKDMNFYAENMNLTTEKKMSQRVGSDYTGSTLGKHTNKITGAMAFESQGEASFASSGDTYINGSKINLNSGKATTKPEEVEAISLISHTDTLFDATKGFIAAPGKLSSITSRAPAHAPWSNAGQGVDVQTDLSSASALPPQPAPAVGAVNTEGANAGVTPVSSATVASVPSAPAASTSLDVNTTGALLGTVAQTTANSPASAAQQQGAAVVEENGNKDLVIGAFGQTPEQLEKGGVIKPGAHRLIKSLINAGASVAKATASILFSGMPGAENLVNYVKNINAQANVGSTNLQQAQTELTNAGVITGNEAPSSIAGLVLATATTGLQSTINAIQTTSTGEPLGSTQSTTLNKIALGVSAVSVASDTFNGLTQSLNAMNANNTGGVETSAFNAIAGSFTPLKPNEPQSLRNNNNKSEEKTQAQSAQNSQTSRAAVDQSAETVTITPTRLISKLTRKPRNLATSSDASGIGNLPGGEQAVSLVKDAANQAKSMLPGTENLSQQINDQTTAALNNIADSTATVATNTTDSLKNKVMSKLNAAQKAQLSAGLAAINSQSKQKTKTTTVATNTVNRESIQQTTRSLLGDPRIPEPNFTGESSSAPSSPNTSVASSRSTDDATLKRIATLKQKIQMLDVQILNLRQGEGNKLMLEERQAPAGDPSIKRRKDELKEKIAALVKDRNYAQKDLELLQSR